MSENYSFFPTLSFLSENFKMSVNMPDFQKNAIKILLEFSFTLSKISFLTD